MTDSSSSTDSRRPERRAFGWVGFPIAAVFTVAALLTYDWRAIAALQVPPRPSSNWIGALGDGFAYGGYMLFGLAIWIVPAICVAAGLLRFAGKTLGTGIRKLWLLAVVACAACLVQSAQSRAPGIGALLSSLNLADAGGAVGHLAMGRLLSPLLGEFGACVLVGATLAVSLVCAVGAGNIARAFAGLFRWMSGGSGIPPGVEEGTPEYEAAQERLRAAARAREEAKRLREEEKQRAREERER